MLHTRIRQFLASIRRIVGMPDYAAYVAEHARAHPGCAPLSEREYFEEYLTRRYEGGPTRCC